MANAFLGTRLPVRRVTLFRDVIVGQAKVKLSDEFESCLEQSLAERLACATLDRVGIHAEEFEVLAIVEQGEELLVLPRSEQVGA